MKNTAIIIIMFLLSLQIMAQSKQETENWIVQKYNNYERKINNDNILKFDNGYLYYVSMLDKNFGTVFKIKVKDIKQIQIIAEKFDSEDDEGWTNIQILFDTKDLQTKDIRDYETNYEPGIGTGFKILVNSEFYKTDLPKRMEKALLHLIKDYGGSASIKKEPF